MDLSIITPEQTIKHEGILNITIPTANGAKQVDQHNGTVELLQKGKATIILQRKDCEEPEKLEIYIQDGIVYVEHSTINLVTAEAKEY